MTKTTGYVLSFALLASSVLLVLSWRAAVPTPVTRAQARAVEVEQPVVSSNQPAPREQELDALRQQVSRLNADLQRVRTSISNATGTPTNEEPVEPLSREEEEQRWLAHVQTLDRAFRDEPLKPGWSREMSEQILAAVNSDELTAGLVVDVYCRSRTCKLELADVDPQRAERGVAHMIQKFSLELQNATIGHNGDLATPKASVLYLSQARAEDSVPLVARR